MPLSRAEIQKRYRERKKQQEGERYLARERVRQKKNYIPAEMLTRSAKKDRNDRIRERVRRCRRNKKIIQEEANRRENNPVSPQSSGYNSQDSAGEPLVVRVPNARRNGPRKRLSKALRKANDKLRKVIAENINVRRKLKTLQRKVQRQDSKKKGPLTPRRTTEKQIKSAGLNKTQAQKIRKQLFLGNVVFHEMKESAKDKNKRRKIQLYGTVAGKIVQKYNCITKLSDELDINRKKLSKVIKQGVDVLKARRKRVIAKLQDSVVNFLEREDNCRMQPGKKDTTKSGTEKVQTRVLTDYMSNLHQKYLSENPESKLSLATFCRIRPKYIHLTGCLSRNVCLCTKHQNVALKLQMMRNEGIDVSKNPEIFIKENQKVEKTQLPENVVYSKWKRVTLENNRKKMKVVSESADRDEFFAAWEKEIEIFNEHYQTMRKQYEQTRVLKDKVPEHEIIVHMDFAENYSCKSAEEVTDAYFTTSQVSLHPIVVYYRHVDGHLAHKSYVAVSGDLTHNSSAVKAILRKFLLKELDLPGCDEVQYVHYWTDSPTSQYRNRFIFHAVANHENLYGCPATWNYYEAGHGKNVCDGLGGTVKRLADEAVRAGKAVIQDAEEFMNWAVQSNMKEVKFFCVEKDEIATEAAKTSERHTKDTLCETK